MYTLLENAFDANDPFWSNAPEEDFARNNPPPIRTKHLPPHVRAIVPLLTITAADYDRCIHARCAIDHEGLIERILKRQRRPPAAGIELYDLRDVLARQDDYELIACRTEGRLSLLQQMERRAA